MSKRSRAISVLLAVLPLILAACALFFYAISKKLPNKTLYSYHNNQITSMTVLGIIGCCVLALFVCISAAALVLFKPRKGQQCDEQISKSYKTARRGAVITLVLIALGVLFYTVILSGWYYYDPKCFEFSDGEHTVVIEEESWLLGGWGNIYQVNDDGSAQRLSRFSTDDGHRNEGNYDINWHDDSADITYDNGNGGRETVTVKFEY